MRHLTVSQGRKLSTKLAGQAQVEGKIEASTFAPPVAVFENGRQYSVVLNLWGIEKKDIVVDVDKDKNEFGVYAGKNNDKAKTVYYWIFGVPKDGLLNELYLVYKNGGLQINVPKAREHNKAIAFNHVISVDPKIVNHELAAS